MRDDQSTTINIEDGKVYFWTSIPKTARKLIKLGYVPVFIGKTENGKDNSWKFTMDPSKVSVKIRKSSYQKKIRIPKDVTNLKETV